MENPILKLDLQITYEGHLNRSEIRDMFDGYVKNALKELDHVQLLDCRVIGRLENDIKTHAVIINGAPTERSIKDYTDKGWIHLGTGLATNYHPYAMSTDHVLFFSKAIDKEAYDKEMAEFRAWDTAMHGADAVGQG